MTGRILVALVAVPALYLVIRHVPPGWLYGVIVLSGLIGQYEFYRLVFARGRRAFIGIGLAGGMLILLALSRVPAPTGLGGLLQPFSGQEGGLTPMVAVTSMVAIAALSALFFSRDRSSSITDVAVLVFGALYVSGLLGHVMLLRGLEHGAELVLYVLLLTWTTDSAAYFGGRRFGRRALAPIVSPNKTVEGALAGLLAAVLMAVIARWWFLPILSLGEAVVVGLLLGVMGQLGDLVESMMKRSAGVKDSGALIPAHGGMLDKIDSLVFTAPTFYYYLVWVKGAGGVLII